MYTFYLNIAHIMSLLIDMLAVGDDLLNLSALKEIQLQKLGHCLTEIDGIEYTQQLSSH